jgi:hypothetical protein
MHRPDYRAPLSGWATWAFWRAVRCDQVLPRILNLPRIGSPHPSPQLWATLSLRVSRLHLRASARKALGPSCDWRAQHLSQQPRIGCRPGPSFVWVRRPLRRIVPVIRLCGCFQVFPRVYHRANPSHYPERSGLFARHDARRMLAHPGVPLLAGHRVQHTAVRAATSRFTPVSCGLESERHAVHAVSKASRRRSVGKHVAQMAATADAMNLGAVHPEAGVTALRNGV